MSELPDGFAAHVAGRDLDAAENLLQDAFPDGVSVSHPEADNAGKALVGFVAACCETGRATQAARIVDLLDRLRTRHSAYAAAFAKATFNVLTTYGEAGDVDRAAVYYSRVIENADRFGGRTACLEIFRSGYGLATYLARKSRFNDALDVVKAMVERLDQVQEQANYPGITAKAAYNVMTACGHRESAEAANRFYQYLYNLAWTFRSDAETAECFARGIHNMVAFLGTEGRFREADQRYTEIDVLRQSWPDNTEIADTHGQCTVNIVAILLSHGETNRAAEIAWAYAEQNRAPGSNNHRYIAKCLFNLVPFLFSEKRRADLEAVYKRLDLLRQERSEDTEIIRSVAAAESNLAVMAAADGRFGEATEWLDTIAGRVRSTGDAEVCDQRADAIVSVAAYAACLQNNAVLDRLFERARALAAQEGARTADRELPARLGLAVVDNTEDVTERVDWLERCVENQISAWNMRLARSSEDVLQQTLLNGAHHLTRRVVKIQDALDMTALHGRDTHSHPVREN